MRRGATVALLLLRLTAVDAAPAQAVSGQVVDEQGRPVPGATVAVTLPGWRRWLVPHVTRTAPGGTFSVDAPDLLASGEPLAVLALNRQAAGLWLGPATNAAKVVVHSGIRAAGRVTDEQGRPVARARVSVVSFDDRRPEGYDTVAWPPPPWPALAAVSAADGTFQLGPLPAGPVTLRIEHPLFATDAITTEAAARPEAAEAQLAPGATLAGRVLRADGTPLAGVPVAAYDLRYDSLLARATTDGAGRYRLTGLNGTQCAVGLADWTGAIAAVARDSLQPRAGHVSEGLDLLAIAGTAVTVAVVDADGGAPVAGATISASGPGGQTRDDVALRTGADGRLTLRLPPGETRVEIGAPGSWISPGPRRRGLVCMVAGETTLNYTVKLYRGRMASGTVVDTEGRPLGNVSLSVDCPQLDEDVGTHGRSDSAGHFRLARVPLKSLIHIMVWDPVLLGVLGTVDVDAAQVPSEDWRLVVAVQPRVALAGRVVDTAGQPLRGAAVTLETPLVNGVHREFEPQETVTDAIGSYHFEGLLRSVRYRVRAQLKGYRTHGGGDRLTLGTSSIGVSDVVLERLDGVARGTVLDAEGRPVAGATVLAMGWLTPPATTRADGTFALSGLPRDGVRVLALAPGQRVAEAAAGETLLRLHALPPMTRARQLSQAAALVRSAWALGPDDGIETRRFSLPVVAVADPATLLDLLSTLNDGDLLAEGLEWLAAAAPDLAAAHLDLLDRLGPGPKAETAAVVGLCLLEKQRDAAARLFDALPPARTTSPRARAAAAVLALRLGRPDGADLLDAVLAALPDDEIDASEILETPAFFAAAQPGVLAKLAATRAWHDGLAGFRLSAIAGLARIDPAAAAQAFRSLLADVGGGLHWRDYSPDHAVLRYVLCCLEARDPAAARALAESLAGQDRVEAYAALAAGTPDVGRVAGYLAAAYKLADGNARKQLDAIAARRAPEQLKDRRAAILADGELRMVRRLDPDRARLLVERALCTAPDGAEPAYGREDAQQTLVLLDVDRAREEFGSYGDAYLEAAQALVNDGRGTGYDAYFSARSGGLLPVLLLQAPR